MMALPEFAAHWSRMGIGTVWTGIETDQLLLDFPPVAQSRPAFNNNRPDCRLRSNFIVICTLPLIVYMYM